MDYNLIVACSNNYGIGNNGKLPWNIPNDLKRFSKLTKGNGNNAIVMGRKTWDSLPIKPLPNRINIIYTVNNVSNFYALNIVISAVLFYPIGILNLNYLTGGTSELPVVIPSGGIFSINVKFLNISGDMTRL